MDQVTLSKAFPHVKQGAYALVHVKCMLHAGNSFHITYACIFAHAYYLNLFLPKI